MIHSWEFIRRIHTCCLNEWKKTTLKSKISNWDEYDFEKIFKLMIIKWVVIFITKARCYRNKTLEPNIRGFWSVGCNQKSYTCSESKLARSFTYTFWASVSAWLNILYESPLEAPGAFDPLVSFCTKRSTNHDIGFRKTLTIWKKKFPEYQLV